jgi:UDPglucose 6-dehydrogenase
MGIGIVGNGWVGRAQHELFPEAVVYDEPLLAAEYQNIQEREVAIAAGRMAINECDVTFVCVPTPNLEDGSLDTSIIEEVVDWCESDLIVIRSTVNPGTADKLEATGKNICVQPEYLGETTAHPLLDESERKFMIIGGQSENRRKLIEAYQSVYNANIAIRQVTNLEAEVIKLSENRAIAWKVAQAQELYDYCEAQGVDYYTVREAVYGDDPRFNRWFTFVYPDRRGMSSKCIPKDVLAWAAAAESVGIKPRITRAILEKNVEWLALNHG